MNLVSVYYYIRGEAYLCAKKWEEAKRDLTAAILQEVDISQAFHNLLGSVVFIMVARSHTKTVPSLLLLTKI